MSNVQRSLRQSVQSCKRIRIVPPHCLPQQKQGAPNHPKQKHCTFSRTIKEGGKKFLRISVIALSAKGWRRQSSCSNSTFFHDDSLFSRPLSSLTLLRTFLASSFHLSGLPEEEGEGLLSAAAALLDLRTDGGSGGVPVTAPLEVRLFFLWRLPLPPLSAAAAAAAEEEAADPPPLTTAAAAALTLEEDRRRNPMGEEEEDRRRSNRPNVVLRLSMALLIPASALLFIHCVDVAVVLCSTDNTCRFITVVERRILLTFPFKGYFRR